MEGAGRYDVVTTQANVTAAAQNLVKGNPQRIGLIVQPSSSAGLFQCSTLASVTATTGRAHNLSTPFREFWRESGPLCQLPWYFVASGTVPVCIQEIIELPEAIE